MVENKKEILFVKYKNYNGNYEAESKLPFSEINADRFNSEYHKKLFWKNLWHNRIKPKKIDWHNPWIVGIGTTVIGGIILALILSA